MKTRYQKLTFQQKKDIWEQFRTKKSSIQGVISWLLNKHGIHGRAILNTGPAVADMLCQFPEFKNPVVPEVDKETLEYLSTWPQISPVGRDFWEVVSESRKKFSFIYFDGMHAPSFKLILSIGTQLGRQKLKSPGALALTLRTGRDKGQLSPAEAETLVEEMLTEAGYSILEQQSFPYRELVHRDTNMRKNYGHPMKTMLWIVK